MVPIYQGMFVYSSTLNYFTNNNRLDVRQPVDWEKALDHCQIVFHASVEVLVNNAGIGPNPDHQLLLRINTEGVINGSQAFLNRFGKSKVYLVPHTLIFCNIED